MGIRFAMTEPPPVRPTTRPPRWLVMLAVVGAAVFVLPLLAVLIRAPWRNLLSLLSSAFVLDALRVSLISSILATAIAAALGVPLAWLLARVEFRGRSFLRALVLLPLVLPPVVGGAALLFAFGRRGLLGEPIAEATGLVLPFSMAGVVLSATFVAMPFLVITVEGALRNLDRRYEAAAASLGASSGRVLWRVTLPMIAPSLAAGLALTWARAFGEFGATITFAGNTQGITRTLPLEISIALENPASRDRAIAISMFMLAVSLTVLITLRDRWIPRR